MKRLFAGVVLSGAAAVVVATEVSVRIPFGSVRAGETARIEWQGLPGDVEELELLLTVEGRELPVRMTPQLSARAGLLMWRVPNLPSPRAHLTIRFGLDGREIESAPSARFEILPAPGEPPAMLAFREGEWWADRADADRIPGTLGHEDGDRVQENRECPPCAVFSSPLPAPETGRARAAKGETLSGRNACRRPVLTREPIEAPARI